MAAAHSTSPVGDASPPILVHLCQSRRHCSPRGTLQPTCHRRCSPSRKVGTLRHSLQQPPPQTVARPRLSLSSSAFCRPACPQPSTLQCLALPSRFLYNSITWGAPPHVAQILPPRIPTQIGLLPRTLFDYICSAPPSCEFTLPTVDSVAVGLQCTLPDAYPELTMPRHRSRPYLQRETAPK